MALRNVQFIFLGSLLAVIVFFLILFIQQETPNVSSPEVVPIYKKDPKTTISFLNKFGEPAGEKAIDFTFPVRQIQFVLEFHHKNKKHALNVFLQGTKTEPPFVACLVDDEAASREVLEKGDMELPTRRLFRFLLQDKCENEGSSSRNLVVDAGANLGYFSTYSAVMGCRVVAFEAQPRLIPIIETSFKVNGVDDRAKVVNNIVTTDPNARLKINYSKGMCWGCSHVSEAKPDEVEKPDVDIIGATRVDAHVDDDILLFKVDVEGYEVLAIESASKVFENHEVKNILVEWNPRRFPHDVEKANTLLQRLIDQGFKLRHYDMRMEIPEHLWTKEEKFEGIGRTWLIPREHVPAMNENLKSHGYGEANFWLSKEY